MIKKTLEFILAIIILPFLATLWVLLAIVCAFGHDLNRTYNDHD